MFERANIASDHQQLLMTVFKTIAKKHGMECLFHEKPFAGSTGRGDVVKRQGHHDHRSRHPPAPADRPG
jgi:glutamine synthetase type III